MREFVDKQAMIDDLKRQCREVFRIDAVKPEDYYIKKDAKFMEDTWTIWCESFYRYLGARTAFTEQEIVKPYLEKIKKQIIEESEFAYANFEEYKDEVLGVESDELPDDDFRYGLERAVNIINEFLSEQEKEK